MWYLFISGALKEISQKAQQYVSRIKMQIKFWERKGIIITAVKVSELSSFLFLLNL